MSKTKRRVVVTGLGPVTSIGLGKKAFWSSLSQGRKNFSKVTRFYHHGLGLKSLVASEIKDYDPTRYFTSKEISRMDRFSQYATTAALMAFADAKLTEDKYQKERFAVVIGTAIGGQESLHDAARTLYLHGIKRISPAIVPLSMPGLASGNIAIKLRLTGPNKVISSSCTSGTHAVGEALHMIRDGYADLAMAGGADACINPWAFIGFCVANAMSTRNNDPEHASRPFDKNRDGFVMGEGAGMLVLEELSHAQKRKAPIYAEVLGYGASADAFHITSPLFNGAGSAQAMKAALADGKVKKTEVSYINAHGSSTKYNDLSETRAIKNVFGKRAYQIPVSSTKSMIGHTQGACGAIASIATVLAIVNDKIHPTLNYEVPDPECDLDYVPNKSRKVLVDTAIVNSLGFGGNNAALVFRKFLG